MLEFLWNVPIFLWELALNVVFWGTLIALLFLILKWGTEKWITTLRNEEDTSDTDQGKPDNWGV